jgi:hypothetical protein
MYAAEVGLGYLLGFGLYIVLLCEKLEILSIHVAVTTSTSNKMVKLVVFGLLKTMNVLCKDKIRILLCHTLPI